MQNDLDGHELFRPGIMGVDPMEAAEGKIPVMRYIVKPHTTEFGVFHVVYDTEKNANVEQYVSSPLAETEANRLNQLSA